MSLGTQTVQVEVEIVAAAHQLASFVTDVKAALKSGNTIEEVLAIGTSGLKNLLPVLQNLATLEADVTAGPLSATVTTAGVVGSALVSALQS